MFSKRLLVYSILLPMYWWKDQDKQSNLKNYFVWDLRTAQIPDSHSTCNLFDKLGFVHFYGELFTTFSSGRQKVFELCVSQQLSICSSFLSTPDSQCLFLVGSINGGSINERGHSIKLLPPILDYFSKIKCVNAIVFCPLIKTWPQFYKVSQKKVMVHKFPC